MPARRQIGALLIGLLLTAPLGAFGQVQSRGEAGSMKTQGPPHSATVPMGALPILPPVAIVPRDRGVIQSYYRSQAKSGHCPPGLAKKQDGCQPPGEARRNASAARPPSTNMSIQPLPRTLLERLTLAPNGYAYGYSNGSVVLYSTGSRIVADSAPAY